MASPPLTLLDTCVVINLYASRRMEAILGGGEAYAIVDIVEREAIYVRRGGNGDDAREKELVDLGPPVAAGVLAVLATEDEAELSTYIDLTVELDRGEAMTVAIAQHRGHDVVTDERKAARILTERGVFVRSTLDLIKAWAERETIEPENLKEVLRDVRARGTYEPQRTHPLKAWWDAILR